MQKKATAKLTLDFVVRWEKPNVRQRDTSRVPIIKLYCDEISIFLQIQGSCGLGEQEMGSGTEIRVQTPCQGSGDVGEDRDPAPAPNHPVPTFPRLHRDSIEGSLCSRKSLITPNQLSQHKISQSPALIQNVTTTPV